MKVNTKLTLMEYLAMVELISSNYFNADGDYQPHIGLIGAMMVFWNYCVKESNLDSKYGHDLEKISDMEEIVNDTEFLTEFAKATDVDKFIDISSEDSDHKHYVEIPSLDFSKAYDDALDIVRNKLSSGRVLIDLVKSSLSELMDNLAPVITPENMDNIRKITDEISNGTISTQSVVDEYKRQAFAQDTLLEK